MDQESKKIAKAAWEKAKNRKVIHEVFLKLIEGKDFSSINSAAAVFMAGSPGAGKTEVAKDIANAFVPAPIRIDADEFREIFDGYNGSNAYLFQQASTTMVQKVLDRIYTHSKKNSSIPFILDGTFSYAKSKENIRRALSHSYAVEIYYVYQRPELAWNFTKARELKEGRVVPEEVFVSSFLQAQTNVIEAKRIFGDRVNVSVILKDTDATESKVEAYLTLEDLEKTINFGYTKETIKALLRQDNS